MSKHKGRVKLFRAQLYRGHMVYIRKIGEDYFDYLIAYDSQVYSSYLLMGPKKGKKKLTKVEDTKAAAIIYAGAVATLDSLLGDEKA